MATTQITDNQRSRSMDVKDYERREKLALLRLTPQEKTLCEVFVTTMDWKVAMKEAGYAMQTKGRAMENDTHNRTQFEQITRRVDISNYILLLRESVVSRLGFSLDDVIEEYRRLAFVKMSDFYKWDAKGIKSVKSSAELNDAQRAQVMEISETTGKFGTTVKIKLFPKQPALDKLYDILKDLQEENDKKKEKNPALVVNKNQVAIFLQDPVKRRSIEHVAEGLFGRKIFLTASDKQRHQFERQLEKITAQYMEATNDGAGRRGFIEHTPVDERPGSGDQGEDLGLGEGASEKDDQTPDRGFERKDGESEYADGNSEGEDEIDAGPRYPDIDGL